MKEVKFRVKGNIFTAEVPSTGTEFDEKFGDNSCVDAATKELIRNFQTSVRAVYSENENPLQTVVDEAIANTTPAKRQTVGAATNISKSKKVRAIAQAVSA